MHCQTKSESKIYIKSGWIIQENFEDSLALLSSINVSMLPLLFFFNFLYYTDTVSTTMVLLMYSLYLSGNFILVKKMQGDYNVHFVHIEHGKINVYFFTFKNCDFGHPSIQYISVMEIRICKIQIWWILGLF